MILLALFNNILKGVRRLQVKTAIIVFVLSMIYVVSWNGCKLMALQNKVACLQQHVEDEWYNTRHNILTLNKNKEINDKNIEKINENFRRIESLLPVERRLKDRDVKLFNDTLRKLNYEDIKHLIET